ncbi:MAG: hypothetical protein JXP34_00770 [Planctomycetes bacterium]|nr:hypothetical protein [Planctomycetota bacterium]
MRIDVPIPVEHDGGPSLVLEWIKREGTPVGRGEIIAYLMDWESIFAIQAPRGGVLLDILADEGDEAEAGECVATLEV